MRLEKVANVSGMWFSCLLDTSIARPYYCLVLVGGVLLEI